MIYHNAPTVLWYNFSLLNLGPVDLDSCRPIIASVGQLLACSTHVPCLVEPQSTSIPRKNAKLPSPLVKRGCDALIMISVWVVNWLRSFFPHRNVWAICWLRVFFPYMRWFFPYIHGPEGITRSHWSSGSLGICEWTKWYPFLFLYPLLIFIPREHNQLSCSSDRRWWLYSELDFNI